ncbi:hypothetical protein Gotur_028453, partial [Gossypium turneri]
RLLLLKDLSISGLDQVHKIGAELFGENQSKAFASLESLRFDNMLNWEEWDLCEDDEQVSKFPSLRFLSIRKCPLLLGRLPTILQSLQTLEIYNCKRLVVSISSFPLLRTIRVEGCEELVDEGSLSVQKVTSLKAVSVSNISNFNISAERIMLRFANSERFNISGWKELGSLSQIGIGNCVNLQYLVDEKENNNKSMSSNTCLLEHLVIRSCPSLIWLSSRGDICNRLQRLDIFLCSKLGRLFLNAKLPVMLKQLVIRDCPVLECIAQDFLETIDLESIRIRGAEKIKSLPRGLDKLSHLQKIQLSECPNLSFEESGLPTTNLRFFAIENCENFGVIPKCINNFTSLRELKVSYCSADISFPEEGFPANLTSLAISNAPKIYTSLVQWGFNRLTSLQRLNISGEGCSNVVSFPEEGI